MKRCPTCRRDYFDDSLLYCLDDGAVLLEGPASMDEPATAILRADRISSEQATRSFEQAPSTGATALDPHPHTASKKNTIIAGFIGIIVVTALGLGSYLYYGRESADRISSVAVMPFVNESESSEIDYLSDGMTETLISSLTQLPNLSVKARSSVFRYKGKKTDPKTIGNELKVQAIVTGRVAQRGDQLTLSLELVDVATENAIWSRQYSRKQADLVSLQSEIARDVSGRLKAKLSGADVAKVEKTYTVDPEAYQLYLKGRFQWNKRTTDSLTQAADHYKKAIEKDPNFARAYAGLAETYAVYGIYAVMPPGEIAPKTKAMAVRALEIDDSLADAHTALGCYYAEYERDWASAEREFRKAIELDPNYATAYQWLGNSVFGTTGRFDEAMAVLQRAEELDPVSPVIGINLGDTFVYMRRYDDAIAKYKSVLALDPNFAFGRFALGWANHSKGSYSEAIGEFRRSLAISYDPQTEGFLAAALAKAGQREEAENIVRKLKDDAAKHFVPNAAIAVPIVALGRKEEALDLLEKAVNERDPYVNWLAFDPVYDDLRNEPRFKVLLKRMNLPE